MAWSFTNKQLRASETYLDISGNSISGPEPGQDEFRIMAKKIQHPEFSSGSSKNWTQPTTGLQFKVKKSLHVTITAPETEWGVTATSDIKIEVKEWALKLNVANGQWETMSQGLFNKYRGGNQDIHTGDASKSKTIDKDTGEVVSEDETIYGDGSETDSNIKITTSWDGDTLTVGWGSSDVIVETTEVEFEFLIKSIIEESE